MFSIKNLHGFEFITFYLVQQETHFGLIRKKKLEFLLCQNYKLFEEVFVTDRCSKVKGIKKPTSPIDYHPVEKAAVPKKVIQINY